MEDNKTVEELEMRLFLCDRVLRWLASDDLMLKDPRYAPLVPEAVKTYTGQFNELVEARQRKLAENKAAEPVQVGLGTAKLTQKVIRSK